MRISDWSSDVCSSDLDRFRFDNKDGRGTYYCNKCGPGDGVQLVMMKTGWPFRQAAEQIREVLPNADEHRPKPTLSEERRLQALRDTWKASKLITAQDDAGRYLASRGFVEIVRAHVLTPVTK